MKQADQIRTYVREKYVAPAHAQREKRFSIRTGEVVRGMRLPWKSTPAVCSALKTRQFLEENALRIVSTAGPPSGLTTTVIYTYEFVGAKKHEEKGFDRQDAWNRLRGALKDAFAELGGGEQYLRRERNNFYSPGQGK